MKTDKPTVIISSRVHQAVIDVLAPTCRVVANQTDAALSPDELQRRCQDADALIAFMPERIDAAFLDQCPRLRIVACALKGYDNFDVAACSRRGVWLTIVPDLLTAPTAELTIGLMIALARNVLPGDRLVRGGGFGGWRPILYGRGIDGSTVGLLGAGAVGKAVARRLAGFRARLLYADAMPLTPDQEDELRLQRVSPDELLRQSDFVVLCLPLTDRTRRLVDRGLLARVKPGAFLINTARGSLVDEDAVADALASGSLGGYAADVFAMEDWALADRPKDIAERLRGATERTVFTPHLGSAVDEIRRDIALQAAASVLECLKGDKPSGAVNRPSDPGSASS
ncbi:phosphonate dehydrogenase [Reyranella sp. CPCC 100927]|uniref:phosphonate dehydrogenase n=1 Tax=Reyranella sp. CPCC 100927 TaxID=2599616 RepID=UPI0011B3F345|nr:phosphonate dehydrogenase [Reyranella sp. CPCC 100927]TWT12631.1 hydroxyacid dehydrogenase [Reyranella sp. CPCC 100927]